MQIKKFRTYLANHHHWADMNNLSCNLDDHSSAINHGLKMATPMVLTSVLVLLAHNVVQPKKRNLKNWIKKLPLVNYAHNLRNEFFNTRNRVPKNSKKKIQNQFTSFYYLEHSLVGMLAYNHSSGLDNVRHEMLVHTYPVACSVVWQW